LVTNLASLLVEHPFRDADPLLHTIDRTVTAGDARKAARSFADRLRREGIRPGQAVAVQLPNGPDAVTTMFGTWLADCVFVPVNPRYTAPEVDRIIDVTCAAAHAGPTGLTALANTRVYEPGTGFVLWTSGTTGAPKAILHTHAAYFEILDRVIGSIRQPGAASPRTPRPNLIPVSLALNAGIYNVLFGLRVGAALVIMDGFETATFADLTRRFEIRSTVLPPAAITMLNDDPSVHDLGPLRYVRSITAPLSPLQARRFTEKFGVFVLNGYGQAEIGEVIGWTADDAKRFPEKIGAVGRPHSGVDVKIIDSVGGPARAGEVGRLWVRPPNRASGFADGEDLDDRVDPDGYVDTGDMARVDHEGFVWIEGRFGDVINRGGNKVFPAEIEEVLRLAPGVSDAAVIGIPDERLGEVPVAFVTGDPVATDALMLLCREHLAPYKVPIAFHHINALPVNEAGKLVRHQLVVHHNAVGQPAGG
jgi:long-chain acyl-CoA synthetase